MKTIAFWKLEYADQLRALVGEHKNIIWVLTSNPSTVSEAEIALYRERLKDVNKQIDKAIPDSIYPHIMYKEVPE
jgi:hypothetical protein